MSLSIKKEITVEFFDVDSMQIVWNGKYFDYFEVARSALFDKLGIDYYTLATLGYQFPLVKNSAKYIKPLRFHQTAIVKATLTEYEYLFEVRFEIREKESRSITTKGSSTQMACSLEGESLGKIPDELVQRIRMHDES